MDGFFEKIFRNSICEDRKLTIFTLPDKRSSRFSSCEQAEEYVKSLPDSCDIYYTMSLISGEPEGRGAYEDTAAIGCVWCDIDVQSESHSSRQLPATVDEAVGFLLSSPLRPSILVNSGYGIHGYWLLDEPEEFVDDGHRKQIANLTRGWHQLICKLGESHGWKIDNLGDLPRVLRVPGTKNNKVPGKQADVRVIHDDPLVYTIEEICKQLPQQKQSIPTQSPVGNYTGRDAFERCLLYLDQIPGAVEGERGGTQTLRACRAIFRFGLDGDLARRAFEHYNAKCDPPWTDEKQIQHKLDDAKKIVERDGEIGKWANADRYETINDVDLTRIIASASRLSSGQSVYSEETAIDLGAFPSECLRPPGLIAEIVDYNLRTAKYPQPILAVAGAIALMATITGRKIQDPSGTRTNLFLIGLGPTRSGKEHARRINKRIFDAVSQPDVYEEALASNAALHGFLQKSPAGLLMLDEFGDFLAASRARFGGNTQAAQIISSLNKLYGSSQGYYKATRYADNSKQVEIDQPHLTLYGTSTGGVFWKHVLDEHLHGGFFGRLAVFPEVHYVPPQSLIGVDQTPPQPILDEVSSWFEFTCGVGNLASSHPVPHTVQYEGDAQRRYEAHEFEIDARRRKELPLRAAIWSGTGERTAKFALLFAASRAGPGANITRDDVDLAILLSNHLSRTLVQMCGENVSENATESAVKRIYRMIREAGEQGISKNMLTRRTQWLPGRSRERNEIFRELIESGMVIAAEVKESDRPKTVFYAVKQNL